MELLMLLHLSRSILPAVLEPVSTVAHVISGVP